MGKADYDANLQRAVGSVPGCMCKYCHLDCWFSSCHWFGYGHDLPKGFIPDGSVVIEDGSSCEGYKLIPARCMLLEPAFATAKSSTKTGYICNKCKTLNEYAAANQHNGTYLCYECR